MKSEELLYSLDHVGEDLLAQAEQTVLVRRRRPWLKSAAAAVLLLCLGTGVLLVLKNRPASNPVAGTNPVAESEPVVTAPTEAPELPMLAVGENYKGVFSRLLDESCLNDQGDSWTGTAGLDRLPVYQSAMVYSMDPAEGGLPCYYGPEELASMLEAAAARLGAALPEERELQYTQDNPEVPVGLSSESDLGTLTVYGDGRVLMLYDFDHWLQPETEPELPQGLTAEQAIRQASMEDCGRQIQARLGLESSRLALWDCWESLKSSWHGCVLYPIREDPGDQLVARYLQGVRLLTADGVKVGGLEWYCSPESGGAPVIPAWLESVGDYPIISVSQAKASLARGNYLYEGDEALDLSQSEALQPELVYLTEAPHSLLLPFYRFTLPNGRWEDKSNCALLYVPAVDPAWLSDWPEQFDPRMLVLGQAGQDSELLMLSDPAAYRGSNPWQEDAKLNTLPVYQMDSRVGSLTHSEERLLLSRALELVNSPLIREYDHTSMDQPLQAETELGLASLDRRGQFTLLLAPEQRFTPELPELAAEERTALRDAVFLDHLSEITELRPFGGSVPGWVPVEGLAPREYPLAGEAEPLYLREFYPSLTGDPRAQLVACNLERLGLLYRGDTLYGVSFSALEPDQNHMRVIRYDGVTGQEDVLQTETLIGTPLTWVTQGNYPLLAPELAQKMFLEGQYLSGLKDWALLPELFDMDADHSQREAENFMDLVYLPNENGDRLLPFYRFLLPLGQDGRGSIVCQPCYVPAVDPTWLSDWPRP